MMTKIYRSLVRAEDGVTAIEYGLIAALLSIGIIASVNSMGTAVITTFEDSASVMDPVALAKETLTDTTTTANDDDNDRRRRGDRNHDRDRDRDRHRHRHRDRDHHHRR